MYSRTEKLSFFWMLSKSFTVICPMVNATPGLIGQYTGQSYSGSGKRQVETHWEISKRYYTGMLVININRYFKCV